MKIDQRTCFQEAEQAKLATCKYAYEQEVHVEESDGQQYQITYFGKKPDNWNTELVLHCKASLKKRRQYPIQRFRHS